MKKIAIIFWALSLRPVWASQFEPQMLEFCALALMMGAVPILFGQNRGHERLAWLNLKSKQAHCLMALAFENTGTPNKACPESHKPARDAESYYQLGEKYYHGLGVKRDDEVAVFYYTKAAKNGHQQAQYLLGCFYYYGTSVQQNHTEALKWLTQAADQHHAPAQYLLGFMYQYGLGVPQNTDKGLRWLTLASNQQYTLAQELLTRLNLRFLP
jgi:hypothetical protein